MLSLARFTPPTPMLQKVSSTLAYTHDQKCRLTAASFFARKQQQRRDGVGSVGRLISRREAGDDEGREKEEKELEGEELVFGEAAANCGGGHDGEEEGDNLYRKAIMGMLR